MLEILIGPKPDRVVLMDVVVKALGKKQRLLTVDTHDESLHASRHCIGL
jgi:hypothetical protein